MKNISFYLRVLPILLLLQCYPAPKVAGQFSDAAFEEMATQMAKGKVKDITVQELHQQEEKVILLDTRELKEYEISHLPNAI